MQDELLEPALTRVEHRPVLGDMLLLHHRDLRVQATRDRFEIAVPDRHVEVHRLLLGRDDRERVKPAQGIHRVLVVVLADVVRRVAVLGEGGPAGHDLGEPVDHLFGFLSFEQLVQVGVPVEVIEVLEQAEVVGLLQIRVRFAAGQPGGEIHRLLLVAQCHLERRLLPGSEPVHDLLLLLDPPDLRQRRLHFRNVGVPGELVAEHHRLDLEAVHRDHPAPRVRINSQPVVRLHVRLRPVPHLIVQRNSLFLERIETHAPYSGSRQIRTIAAPPPVDGVTPSRQEGKSRGIGVGAGENKADRSEQYHEYRILGRPGEDENRAAARVPRPLPMQVFGRPSDEAAGPNGEPTPGG
nr:hypothetical protein [Frankia sp. QA3]